MDRIVHQVKINLSSLTKPRIKYEYDNMNCAKYGSLLAPNSKFYLKYEHPMSLEPAVKSRPHSGIEMHQNKPKPGIHKHVIPQSGNITGTKETFSYVMRTMFKSVNGTISLMNSVRSCVSRLLNPIKVPATGI